MASIPPNLSVYADRASELTGLDKNVILSQWIAENGWTVPNGFNFGNIRTSNIDYLNEGKIGTTSGGFNVYATPEAGINAWVNLIIKGPGYEGIRTAAGGTAADQINAIVQSPWDSGHYGGDGAKLFAVYNSVTGARLESVVKPAELPQDVPEGGGIKETIGKVFWLVLGLVLVGLGLFAAANPLANLTTALEGVN